MMPVTVPPHMTRDLTFAYPQLPLACFSLQPPHTLRHPVTWLQHCQTDGRSIIFYNSKSSYVVQAGETRPVS